MSHLLRLIALLAGRPSMEMATNLVERRAQQVGWRLGTMIRQLERSHQGIAVEVVSALNNANEVAFDRVMRAPELWKRLHSTLQPMQANWLLEMLRVEAQLMGAPSFASSYAHTPQGDGWAWTALGDMAYRHGEVVRMPMIAESFCVDGYSPNAIGKLEQVDGNHNGWDTVDFQRAVDAVSAAVALIGARAPVHTTLVKKFTHVVVLRSDTARPAFRSCSTPVANGRPVLHNAHLPDASTEALAEALLHESVHSLLDLVELDTPFTTLRTGRVALSPWTGRALSVSTYLQACWIWFAVAWFWRAQAPTTGEGLRLQERCENGFRQSLLEPLLACRWNLGPGVAEALEQLRSELGYA